MTAQTKQQTRAGSPGQQRLSVVVPMYNEADLCDAFFGRLVPVLEAITPAYEIICVNDGSQDFTLAKLLECRDRNQRIKIVNLLRNFGKEVALTAGIEHASGNAIIPIDADLQDPPELIPELVKQWHEGFDMVIARRTDRTSDSFSKRVTANLFYHLVNRIGDIPIPANTGDFRLMDRRVTEVLKQMPERTRFMKGIFAWPGFTHAIVDYSREARAGGKTKWSPWRLWNFALDGLFSFSTWPLRIWSYLGFIVAGAALAYMMFVVVRTLILGIDVPGYASILVVILFTSGVNLIGLGMIGEYLGRVFIEVKGRPLYLVQDRVGFGEEGAETGQTAIVHKQLEADEFRSN